VSEGLLPWSKTPRLRLNPRVCNILIERFIVALQKYFPAVIAARLELTRWNSAGIELFYQALVAELFNKPVVNKLGDERFGGLARDA
jgi:hypothetical protein